MPLKLGLSGKDYYEDSSGDDNTFGYFDLAFAVTFDLLFIPQSFGEWSFTAAGHFLFLGDTTEEFNKGDKNDAYGLFGFSMSY